jgi:hypothetical protein
MKLSQLAAQPQLQKIILDDEATVKEYGEAIEFWVYDRQDMDTYMKMATLKDNDFSQITGLVKDMILDEKGNPILDGKRQLPVALMIKVVERVVQNLGNVISQTMKK